MWRIFSGVFLFVLVSYVGYGQASKSPFTSQGIGEIYDYSMIHNKGMAGLGLTSGTSWFLNVMNPALSSYNYLTIFQAGINTEKRTIFSANASSVNNGGNLSYLAMAFPIISGKWSSGFGLTPYSSMDYEYTTSEQIPGSSGEAFSQYEGEGGFNQLYWVNGFKITNAFRVGVRASYIFSSINRQNTTIIADSVLTQNYQATLREVLSASDVKVSLGAVYSIDSILNRKNRISIGAVYELAADINTSELTTLERNLPTGVPYRSDTLSFNENGSIFIPSSLGVGISFNRVNHWLIGVEYKMQNWSDFKNFNGSNENLSDRKEIIIGAEIVPDYASVSSYFKRIIYRAGFNYVMLPYTVGGNQVKEFGINFGLSLPVSRFSSIDLSAGYGKRGKISETTIQEEVWRFGFGITFNDQWFIRRKYD